MATKSSASAIAIGVFLAGLAACSPAPPDDGQDYEVVAPSKERKDTSKTASDDETELSAVPAPPPELDRTPDEDAVPKTPPAVTVACEHECTTDGQSQCADPSSFRTCVTDDNGCRKLTAAKACARSVPSPGCYAYGRACFGTCKDVCTTEGEVLCTGPTSYQRCVRGSDQCLGWKTGSCHTSTICFASPATCGG